VVELPHYPWERMHHAPEAPAPTALLAPPARAPIAAARDQVHRHVAALLGHRDASAVPDDASFFDLGLDSLMAADLARELSLAFALALSIAHIFEHPTVTDLAAAVASRLSATPAPASTAGANGRARATTPEAASPRAPRTAAGAARAPRIAFLFSGGGSQ